MSNSETNPTAPIFLEFDFLRKREKSVANSWESEKVVGESPEGRT